MNTIMVGNVCVDQHRKVELLYLEDEYVSKEAVPITLLTEYVDEISLLDSDESVNRVGVPLGVVRGYYLFGRWAVMKDIALEEPAEVVSDVLGDIVHFLMRNEINLDRNFFYLETIEIKDQPSMDRADVLKQVLACLPTALSIWAHVRPDLLICSCGEDEKSIYREAGYEVAASEGQLYVMLPLNREARCGRTAPGGVNPIDGIVDTNVLVGMITAIADLQFEGYISERMFRDKVQEYLNDPPVLPK